MITYKKLPSEKLQYRCADEDMLQKQTWIPRLARSPRRLATGTLFVILLAIGIAFWIFSMFPWGLDSESTESEHGGNVWEGQIHEHSVPNQCSSISEPHRFDCYPERNVVVTQELCEKRGCCFIEPSHPQVRTKGGVPWCFYPPDFPTYTLESLKKTNVGLLGQLRRKVKAYYPKDIESLQLLVNFETDTRLHIKLTDSTQQRYEVPIEVPPMAKKAQNPSYTVDFSKNPFGVVVRRRKSQRVL